MTSAIPVLLRRRCSYTSQYTFVSVKQNTKVSNASVNDVVAISTENKSPVITCHLINLFVHDYTLTSKREHLFSIQPTEYKL